MMELDDKDELKDVLKQLNELLGRAIRNLQGKKGAEELLLEAESLMRENKKMLEENIDREAVLKHINRVKRYLNRIRDIDRGLVEEGKEEDIEALREDIGLIEQILEEEIPSPRLKLEEKKGEEFEKPEIEKTIDRLLGEIDRLKEYLRVVSDKIFDIGEEVIELKDRVQRLEEKLSGLGRERELGPVIETPVEEYVTGEKYEERELDYLIKDALSAIGKDKEQPLKRAIKLEALKMLMKNKLDEIEKYPKEIAERFKQVYSMVINETESLRRIVKEIID